MTILALKVNNRNLNLRIVSLEGEGREGREETGGRGGEGVIMTNLCTSRLLT